MKDKLIILGICIFALLSIPPLINFIVTTPLDNWLYYS